jgi:hypothetical protein
MLARQWQMGEFQGDDAGSPVLARACIDVMKIDRPRLPTSWPMPGSTAPRAP